MSKPAGESSTIHYPSETDEINNRRTRDIGYHHYSSVLFASLRTTNVSRHIQAFQNMFKQKRALNNHNFVLFSGC